MPIDETSPELKLNHIDHAPSAHRPLWRWFIVGYSVVFIGLLFTRAYPLSPNGDAVVICRLWQYYIREAHRAMTSSGDLGPASRSFSAAWETAIQHIVLSAAGGAAMAGIAWAIKRTKVPRRKSG